MQEYQIKGPWPGKLAIIPRPRGGDWLVDEIIAVKDAGFNLVVSLLTPAEIEELGLTGEAEVVGDKGLQFCSLPIPDLGVPPSRESAIKFLETLHQSLLAGK